MPKFNVKVYFSGYTEEDIDTDTKDRALRIGRSNALIGLHSKFKHKSEFLLNFINTLKPFEECDEVEKI